MSLSNYSFYLEMKLAQNGRLVFTDRIRSMGEGTVFTGVCLSTEGRDSAWRGVCKTPNQILRKTTLRYLGRPPPPPGYLGRPPSRIQSTQEYGQYVVGTYPTGMHYCLAHYLLHFMMNSPDPQNLILVSIIFQSLEITWTGNSVEQQVYQ